MGEFDIEQVLSQLTLHEKISLLSGIDFWHTFPVHRLDIPSLRFSDGPNGVRGTKFFNGVPSACFPCGTALASTFDKQLLLDIGRLMGEEAIHKSVHVVLGPTTNMQRGPLGGRGFESFSEDPYLAGMASASIINGIQDKKVAATIKHFVGNDLEDQRNSSNSIITERALREIYLEPFRIAVKLSNPMAVMTGYNRLNGEHVSQSEKLLQDILRDEWKWDGTIMSDWFGTYSTKEALANGLDIEMPGPTRFRNPDPVAHSVNTKELHSKVIDERARNVLKLIKYTKMLNLPENGPESDLNNTPQTQKLLKEVAADSIVLLKNEDVLPLNKNSSIAVIGPNAKYAAYCGGGSAALRSYYSVTPFEGIAKKMTSSPKYALGAMGVKSLQGLAENLTNPFTGKRGYNMKFFKEPSSSSHRELVDELNLDLSHVFLADYKNPKLDSNLYFIDFEGDLVVNESGEYAFGISVYGTAQLFVDGKLLVDNKTSQSRGDSFFNLGTSEKKGTIFLEKGKEYKIRVEFGSAPSYTLVNAGVVEFGGGGGVNLGFSKVYEKDEEIKKAVEVAKSVDNVVLCIGLNQEWESESFDRPDMNLPPNTDELVEAVINANPNTIVVNQSGTPVELPWVSKAKGLIQAWFGGNELGNALADVLFGDTNPSGKLSLSFPKVLEDNPTYLNFKTEMGRVLYGEDIYIGYRFYQKMRRDVAFPFGFGLSYTSFGYSDLNIELSEDKLDVTIKVKNNGPYKGKDVPQLYISALNSAVSRPVRELKGFEKIELESGESTLVHFDLPLKECISYFDEYMNQWCAEAGAYTVEIGKSSEDIVLHSDFAVKETTYWLGA